MNVRTSFTVFGALMMAIVARSSDAHACAGGYWAASPAIGAINDSSVGMLALYGPPAVTEFSHENWSGGSRKALFGNLDRNPGSEAIAITDSDISVKTWNLPADGSAPSYNDATVWNDQPFYGNVDTMVADMNNDGLDDIVAWNVDNIAVMHSNGSGFDGSFGISWGDYYGSRANLVGDVNGDNYPDLVVWNFDLIGVRYYEPATGGWGSTQTYSNVSFISGAAANIGGDINGDGNMDLIAIGQRTNSRGMPPVRVRRGSSAGFGFDYNYGEGSTLGAKAYFTFPVSGGANHSLFEVRADQQTMWSLGSDGRLTYYTVSRTPFFGTRFTGGAWMPAYRVNIC